MTILKPPLCSEVANKLRKILLFNVFFLLRLRVNNFLSVIMSKVILDNIHVLSKPIIISFMKWNTLVQNKRKKNSYLYIYIYIFFFWNFERIRKKEWRNLISNFCAIRNDSEQSKIWSASLAVLSRKWKKQDCRSIMFDRKFLNISQP